MLRDPYPRDMVMHVSGRIDTVIDVNNKHGTFTVQIGSTKKKKVYTMGTAGNESYSKLTNEEVVAFFLQGGKSTQG
jgi:hypothetical protein